MSGLTMPAHTCFGYERVGIARTREGGPSLPDRRGGAATVRSPNLSAGAVAGAVGIEGTKPGQPGGIRHRCLSTMRGGPFTVVARLGVPPPSVSLTCWLTAVQHLQQAVCPIPGSASILCCVDLPTSVFFAHACLTSGFAASLPSLLRNALLHPAGRYPLRLLRLERGAAIRSPFFLLAVL